MKIRLRLGYLFLGAILGIFTLFIQVKPVEAFSFTFPNLPDLSNFFRLIPFPNIPSLSPLPTLVPLKPLPTLRPLKSITNPFASPTPTPTVTPPPTLTPTETPTPTPSETPTPTLTPTQTPTPTVTQTPTPTLTPTVTPSETPTPSPSQTPTPTPTTASTAGLVAYWKMDEGTGYTVTDSSGHGHTLTLVNFDSDVNGGWNDDKPTTNLTENNGSLLFDGTNDIAITPDSPDLGLTTAFTIEVWIKADSFQITGDQGIIAKWNGNGYLMQMIDGKINNLTDGNNSSLNSINLRDNSWHHAVTVWDGSYKYIYIDGLLDVKEPYSIGLNVNSEPFMVGNYWSISNQRNFHGNIDEVKIWNVARSQTEIQADAGLPVGTGSVVINEIMWAGNDPHISDEWIELKNYTSSPVNLTNWVVENLGESPANITISSTAANFVIPANGYYLIAHYNEDDSSSILNIDPDFVIPGIGLNNSGEQLVLKNNTGEIIDKANQVGGWFAGTSAVPNKSMFRRNPPGDGSVATNWYTSNGSANLDSGAAELATPKSDNL